MTKNNEIKLLKNRYENKRKDYKKLKEKALVFTNKTYKLLKMLGMSEEEIISYCGSR